MKTLLISLLFPLSTFAENPLAIPAEGPLTKPADFSFEEFLGIAQKHLSEDADPPTPNATLEETAKRLATPEAAFAFVRDKIALQAYAGSMRGPELCLAAAAGNSIDRTALLGEILRLQGHSVRYSHGTLSEENSLKALAWVTSEPVLTPAAKGPFFDALIATASNAFAPLRQAGAEKAAASLRPEETRDAVLQDLRDHWWIEIERDGNWIPMDPLFRDSKPDTKNADTEETLETIPDDRAQTISLKIIAQFSREGKVTEETALEHETTVEEFSTSIVTLGRSDTGYGDGIAKKIGSVVGINTYQPALQIGQQVHKGSIVQLGTKSPESGETGGLLDELSFGETEETSKPTTRELVGLILEITCHAPGREPLVSRRILYNRIPPAERLAWDTAGRPADTTITPSPEIPGELASVLNAFHIIHAYHGAHNIGAWVTTNRRIIRSVLAQAEAPATSSINPDSNRNLQATTWRALPIISDLFLTPALNDLLGLRFQPAFPRITIVTLGKPADSEGMVVLVDLLQDELRAVAMDTITPQQIVLRQLWKAALDGALESKMADIYTSSIFKKFETLDETATHLTALRAATPEDAETGGFSLRANLAAGNLALVDQTNPKNGSFWEINAATGSTKAICEPGLGAKKAIYKTPGTLKGGGTYNVDPKTFRSRRAGTPKAGGAANEYANLLDMVVNYQIPGTIEFHLGIVTVLAVAESIIIYNLSD